LQKSQKMEKLGGLQNVGAKVGRQRPPEEQVHWIKVEDMVL